MKKEQPVRRIMSVADRERLSRDINTDEEFSKAVKEGDTPPGMMTPISDLGDRELDTAGIDKSIQFRKRVLAEGTPERLSGPKREQAEKRRKEIAAVLSERLLTHKEQDLMPKNGYDYHRAVRKTIKQEVGNPETQAMMREYRELSAQLDPDDPEAQSVEALRRRE